MQALYPRTTPSAKTAALNWDLVFQSSCFLEMIEVIWDKDIKGLILLIPLQNMTEAAVFWSSESCRCKNSTRENNLADEGCIEALRGLHPWWVCSITTVLWGGWTLWHDTNKLLMCSNKEAGMSNKRHPRIRSVFLSGPVSLTKLNFPIMLSYYEFIKGLIHFSVMALIL